MLAKDIMSPKPDFLLPEATLKQAADQMSKNNYGFVPIGEGDRLIGALTDRDITVRGVAKGKDPNKTTVREVMTKGIRFCFEEDDIEKVAHLMEKEHIRRLVVLNKDRRLTGIISLGDFATKCHDEKLCCELTDAVSEH